MSLKHLYLLQPKSQQAGDFLVSEGLNNTAEWANLGPNSVVQSISAGDATIVIGGTSTNPTIEATGNFIAKDVFTTGNMEANVITADGNIITPAFQLTTNPTANFVLTSDALGNAKWKALNNTGLVTSVTAGDASISIGGTAGMPTVAATGNFIAKDILTSGNVTANNITANSDLVCAAFQLTASPTVNYVLTSDSSGDGTWLPVSHSGAVTAVSAADATIVIGGTATAPTVAASGNFIGKNILTIANVTANNYAANTQMTMAAFRLTTTPTANFVLTSNATGVGSWSNVSAAGAVTSVTAGDASITIGGTATAPTVTASGNFLSRNIVTTGRVTAANATVTSLTASMPVLSDSGDNLVSGLINLANTTGFVTGTLGAGSGGTGDNTFTTNVLLATGTTSTGAFQTIGSGTTGQYLVSAGSSALPSFQTVQIFSSAGSANGTQYATTSTTMANIDATNLKLTITIPLGSKLLLWCQGFMNTNSASGGLIGIFDNIAAAVISTGGRSSDSAGSWGTISVRAVIAGDGNSHTITLQFKTNNSGSAFDLGNGALGSSAINATGQTPSMIAELLPSA
jgi:hypothetical protein